MFALPMLVQAQATPVGRDTLSMVADVAVISVAAAVLILALVLAFVLLKLQRGMNEIRIGVRQNLGPVSDRARSISDNVDFITQALRTDVERLNSSVRALSDRLHQASDRMEDRIEEFNALMEVVQGEAEEIFIDTASTMRGVREGVREGARSLSGQRPAEEPPLDEQEGPIAFPDETDAPLPLREG